MNKYKMTFLNQLLSRVSAIFLFSVLGVISVFAQGTLKGMVTDADGKPIQYATVALNSELVTNTDAKGAYTLKNIPAGNYNCQIIFVGYKTISTQLKIKDGQNLHNAKMTALSLKLNSVTVTAQQEQMGSKSKIDQEAIRHIQPKSLNDMLQLVPGNLVENPNLNNLGQAQIREMDNNANNALGTSVVVDGTPLSNDANLQVVSPTRNGTNSDMASSDLNNQTTAGRGVDIRTVSVGNVENVEVIRGIPSVEYGNLTSGVVIVNTKSGKTPLEIKTQTDPNSKLIYAGKGFDVKGGGAINTSLDWAQSWGDTRRHYKGFDRVTAGLGYSNQFGPLSLNFKSSFYTNVNTQKDDPQMVSTRTHFNSKNTGVRASLNGKYKPANGFITSLSYNLSGQYSHSVDKHDTWVSNPDGVVSTARESGTHIGRIQSNGYQTYYQIDGKPINFFGQLIATKYLQLNDNDHTTFKLGAEYTLDKNNGEGFTYDEQAPPQAQGTHTLRPRPFKDIPGTSALSAFFSNRTSKQLFGLNTKLDAGVRYSHLFVDAEKSGGHADFNVFEPRVNASLQLLNRRNNTILDDFTITGGYGISHKLPTLLYLYPDYSYFDNVCLAKGSGTNPEDKMGLIKTDVIKNTGNPNLKPTRSNKWELGFSFGKGKIHGFLTYFNENHVHEYGFHSELVWQEFNRFNVPAQATNLSFDGTNVTYDLAGTRKTADTENHIEFYTWGKPSNTTHSKKHGIEYGIDLGQFKPLLTSLSINGAWLHTERTSEQSSLNIRHEYDDYVAVMPAGYGSIHDRVNTTFRFVTHIPAVKMIFTTSVQVVWYESTQSVYKNNDGSNMYYLGTYADDGKDYLMVNPIGYYDQQQNYHTWTAADASSSETNYMIKRYYTYGFEKDVINPWAMLCFRFTKELGKVGELSFIANNFTSTRKWHQNKYSLGLTQLYPDQYFGAELKLKF